MKLWDVKAQALRLMFADTDIEFSEQEFEEGLIYHNSNTREKLVRMDDVIRRGIDMYFAFVKEPTTTGMFDIEQRKVGLENTDVGLPERVDLLFFNDENEIVKVSTMVDHIFDNIKKEIIITEKYDNYGEVKARIWYRFGKRNIPMGVDELSYDLNEINIPEDVQRMLPYFVKGELYEEDEVNLALNARNQFMSFLVNYQKPFSNVQRKVKTAKLFSK